MISAREIAHEATRGIESYRGGCIERDLLGKPPIHGSRCDKATAAIEALLAESLRPGLEALYARHCECRPLRADRSTYGHSHDCDTGITDAIEEFLAQKYGADWRERFGVTIPKPPSGGRP